MSGKHLEQATVDQVVARVEGAAAILREHKIAPSGMRLTVAAAAASVTTDELLAVMEERARRHALRTREAQREREREYAY